ncbi:hypothetical protein WJX73_001207 [Symbiochloris irregularis]|uniref:Uncharacterized protein n=1 Tax=Symbiochloris irregularis TaxID=706552 RepID=A0AAW1NEN1_9CHLO
MSPAKATNPGVPFICRSTSRSDELAQGLSFEDAAAVWEARDEHSGATGVFEAVQHSDLVEQRGCNKPIIFRKLERAYGPHGMGVLLVTRMPPEFVALRRKLLFLAEQVANLPEAVQHSLEDPESAYSFGYSCGKEALEDGKPDSNKVSYYANPQHNTITQDAKLRKRYSGYCRDNIWPTQALPELETTFQRMGELIIQVGMQLAGHIDQYLAFKGGTGVQEGGLRGILARSSCHKGRLLHYKPLQEPTSREELQKWCGRHTDHGSLTGLLSAMFMQGGQEVRNPDSSSGLHILDRSGYPHRVAIPPDGLAFQMGEASQVHSGGLLQATPHYVQAADAVGVSRNTFAVFMQPRWDEPMAMPEGADAASVGIGQWRPGLSFGEFADLTVQGFLHDSHAGTHHAA